MNQAAGSSVTVIINTATIVGFGAVAKITPFYAWAVELLEASTANPYVVAAVGSKLFACILGSSSGGLTLMYTSLKEIFLSYAGRGTAWNLSTGCARSAPGGWIPCPGTAPLFRCSASVTPPTRPAIRV